MKLLMTAIGVSALLAQPADAYALGTLADISIFDRGRQETLPVYEHDGRYYVAGEPGNEYEIRLSNGTGRDVLAVVSVDGVNVVTGETAAWQQSGYVLGAWSGATIRGWRKSLERTAAFFFTSHRNSYAARTGRPQDVGVIGLAIFESRVYPPPPLEFDPYGYDHALPDAPAAAQTDTDAGAAKSRAEGSSAPVPPMRREAQLGTGHGRSEHSPVRYASFERASDHPAEVVIIHYDSYRNLVARHVIPPRDLPPAQEPNPFPGQFVPDPNH
jgi:hypothetical protein